MRVSGMVLLERRKRHGEKDSGDPAREAGNGKTGQNEAGSRLLPRQYGHGGSGRFF